MVLPAGTWSTVLDFLCNKFPRIPAEEWQARMQRGDVLDVAGQALALGTRYTPHSKVFYYRALEAEPRIPFEETVLFQDAYLVVANKPHFLPVTPSGAYLQETLLVRLKRKLNLPDLAPLHRIDRETAGLVLFAIQPHTRAAYQNLFRDRQVTKHYEAIAGFRADLELPLTRASRLQDGAQFMQMQEVPGEANSETRIELLRQGEGDRAGYALYLLKPLTGQKHQLRVHMAALGLGIVNDTMYPDFLPSGQPETPDYSKPLQLLAKRIEFVDPISQEQRIFESNEMLYVESYLAAAEQQYSC